MEELGNYLHLSGVISQSPTYGHEVFGEKFYYATLSVPRLSGAEDLLPHYPEQAAHGGRTAGAGRAPDHRGAAAQLQQGHRGRGRLLITAFVQRILPRTARKTPTRCSFRRAL